MPNMYLKDFNDKMKTDFENCIRLKRPELWEKYQQGKDITVAKIIYLEPDQFEVA